MSTQNEIAVALEWLYSLLSGDATLAGIPIGGVYRAIAPDDAVAPYIILQWMGGHDVLGSGGARIMSDLVFQVYAIAPSDQYDLVRAAAYRIDQLLDKASGTTSDGTVLACRRQQPIPLDEVVNGVVWSRLGGLYRTWVN